MKSRLFFILFYVFTLNLFAQRNDMLTTLDATVYTTSFDKAKADLNKFLKSTSAKVISQNESTDHVYVQFYVTKETFQKMDTFLLNVGFVSSKDVRTSDNELRNETLQSEIDFLNQKKAAYEAELASIKEKDERYYRYWEGIRDIEKQIFDLKKNMQIAEGNTNYIVNLHVYDEVNDLTSDKISWVNMPGVTYDMLFIENPVTGLSAESYAGYNLKYLFTRGKSFVCIGALKQVEKPAVTDSSMFKEMFLMSFGQDFYTKHFGRGKRKFLNLYTGYNVGGLFATSELRNKFIPACSLFLGLEIYKNKYILLDNKVGYFVPFYENRNMRGISYQASFNFVF